ncbi:MAG: carbon monoxide dehydrogenase accessory protein CooC [Anaerolineaceae bacterium]|nr:carbon monoxide dehydrogenase accessory protein CooC [Anaerolineaceae bacterium]
MNKIAVAGKGGVGKTTLAALLARIYAGRGQSVIAVDADPAACLGFALGLPPELQTQVTPISEMDALIEERTGAKTGTYGTYFKLNPRVDDIPERFCVQYQGVRLLRLGTIDQGGSGCICPESAMLKALVSYLILHRDEMLILDMDAGLEHLGRATAGAVDYFLVVVEPGKRSMETAHQIARLAADIGIRRVGLVGNKVRSQNDRDFIIHNSGDLPVFGYLSYHPEAIQADQDGASVYHAVPQLAKEAEVIADALLAAVA